MLVEMQSSVCTPKLLVCATMALGTCLRCHTVAGVQIAAGEAMQLL